MKERKMMRTELVKVTPEIAKVWLQTNTNNRPLRMRWVNEIANAIRRGEFQLTHQGIAFDISGVLLDGQHRLAAIAEAGIAVDLMVTWGAPPQTFQVLDIGQKRTVSFVTQTHAYVVSVARVLLAIASGDIYASYSYSPGQISMVSDKLKLVDEPIMQINLRYRRKFISKSQVTASALTVCLMHPEERNKIISAYEAASQLDFKNMPPTIQTLWVQLNDGLANTKDRVNLIARAYVAFSRCIGEQDFAENAKRQLVIVNPEKHVQIMAAYWKNVLRDCL